MIDNNFFIKLLSDNEMSWRKARFFLEEAEKNAKREKINLDDVIFNFFVGNNVDKIGAWSNKKLLATMLMKLVWLRLSRRSVSWHEGGDVLVPKANSVSKLEIVVNRCKASLISAEDGFFEAILILVCLAKGDYFESYRQAVKLKQKGYPKDAVYRSFFTGVNSFYITEFFPELKDIFEDDKFRLNIEALKKAANDNFVSVVSCDITYYDKFSADFLSSARESGYNNTIIFFVIGDKEGWEVVEKGAYVFYVSTTYNLEPALYASFRYLISRYILEDAKCGLFVFDIDFIFNEQVVSSLYSTAAHYDMAFTFHGYGIRSIAPWTKISAPLSFFGNNKQSELFLNNYIGYWEKVWGLSDFKWWIDQNSLFSSYQYIQKTFPSAKIKNIFDVANIGVSNKHEGVLEFKKSNRR